VKEVVLPFSKFPGADTLLGPEMRSTGEVMGIDYDFASSYAKAQIAAGAGKASLHLPCHPAELDIAISSGPVVILT
jgi:carbamoylphosphate synthase large subunit